MSEFCGFARDIGQCLFDAHKVRFHKHSQFGQADTAFVSLEQPMTAFALQLLDRARERWLCNAATSGRTREALLVTEGEEISDLVHPHAHVRNYRAAKSMARESSGEVTETPIAST